MIPKILHFCWLSDDPYPPLVKACLNSWRENMPDYEIMLWNTTTFDIESVPFVKQACVNRKWAFAADYIRLYALYNYGGIYLDSDVYLFRSLDDLLGFRAFSAIESCLDKDSFTVNIEAAFIGAERHHPFIKSCLDYYQGRQFQRPDGSFDQTILPLIIGDIAELKFGFERKAQAQNLNEGLHILSMEQFAHAHIETYSISHCYGVHLCEGGWYNRGRLSSFKRLKSLMIRFRNKPVKTFFMLYWNYRLRNMLYK